MTKAAAQDANNNLQQEAKVPSPLQDLENAVSTNFDSFEKSYTLGRKLGEGNFGAVYVAKSAVDEKQVAVKVQHATPENAANRLRELKSMKIADNMFITRYIDSYLASNKLYIVMEFVDGMTLRDLAYRFQLRYETIAAIIASILKALSHIHQRNLMHRDVKGDNILVGKNGEVKLADFGLAMLEGTPVQSAQGSPPYMAPEALTSGNYNVKVDIWSLGMTLLQTLNRAMPYAEVNDLTGGNELETVNEICRRIVNNELPRLHNKENIPGPVKAFMRACVTYNPSERPDAKTLLGHEFISRGEPPQKLRETMNSLFRNGRSFQRRAQ